MPNIVTQLVTRELARELDSADGLLFVSFGGLDVQETEALRTQLAERGVRLRMVRNKLAQRVLAEKGIELPEGTLRGNVAVAYGDAEAAIVAAKVFTQPEVKKAGKITVRAGVLEGNVLDAADATQLADVPDRDTLRAKILGCISGPARGIAASIAAVPGGLARVLQAHADAGEAQAGA